MDTTYDIVDIEATVKMLTDRHSHTKRCMETQTNRQYGNTDKQIVWKHRQTDRMETQTNRSYGNTGKQIVWKHRQTDCMETQTNRSHGNTDKQIVIINTQARVLMQSA